MIGLELASLHSVAVDYPKSGNPAIMPRYLRALEYPHFMEKKNGEKTYRSRKILGRLYDLVERVDFHPVYNLNFDERILKYDVSERLLRSALSVKEEYDTAMYRIMSQYGIKTEFEVFSRFVLGHASTKNDYNFHEEVDRIMHSLSERFKNQIIQKVGGRYKTSALASFVAAMYRVTYEEVKAAVVRYESGKGRAVMPLVSFPWIFQDMLGTLAMGDCEFEFDPPTTTTSGEPETLQMFLELDYVAGGGEVEVVETVVEEEELVAPTKTAAPLGFISGNLKELVDLIDMEDETESDDSSSGKGTSSEDEGAAEEGTGGRWGKRGRT